MSDTKIKEEQKKPGYRKGANPVDTFNHKDVFNPVDICNGSKNFEPAGKGTKDIIVKGGETAFEWDPDQQNYYTVINDNGWQKGARYSPFQLLEMITYRGSFESAANFVKRVYMERDGNVTFIRIGTDYYKIKESKNENGETKKELLKWTKEEIKQDFSNSNVILKSMRRYDKFTIEPSNTDYRQSVDGNWNMYSKFPHKVHNKPVSKKDIPLTANFMAHIFGEQLELGYQYMKVLYERPKQKLPVLCLVSKEQQTGKTTFIDWLQAIFGDNYSKIPPENLSADFNSSYAESNIIATDEAFFDKKKTVERIKSLATAKTIKLNKKYVSPTEIPFHGKIVMCTNNQKDFIRISKEEVRFWVRKLGTIPEGEKVVDFPEKIAAEIPKFLRYLQDHISVEYGHSRMVFTAAEIKNDHLKAVKSESRSWLYKELEEYIQAWFYDNPENDTLYSDVKNIKNRWFENDKNARMNDIRKVLNDEMEMETTDDPVYISIMGGPKDTVRAFRFNRCDYVETSGELPTNGAATPTNGTAKAYNDTDEYPF